MPHDDPTSTDAELEPTPRPPNRSRWRLAIWAALAILAVVASYQLVRIVAAPPAGSAVTPFAVPTPTDAPAAFPTPAPGFVSAAATPVPPTAPAPAEPPPTPTLAADETLIRATPAASQAGWVGSDEARGNHFGDSFLHAGVVQGQIFHGVLQFDLSRVARGAPIRYAALQLTGLDDNRLDRTANNAWSLRWLDPTINADWSRASFQDIHNAAVLQTILPPLGQADLAPFSTNQFVFDEQQLQLLEQALVDNQTQIAFRIDGPEVSVDDLFTWDSGYGPATEGSPPLLLIVAGPPPATPPPIPTEDYVVVTSTPTPANVLTAAAIVLRATDEATRLGTPTPTPPNLVTATPTPENAQTAEAQRLLAGLPLVVTPTPEAENGATAAAISAYATAVAVTTGTFTPLPADYVTATPVPPEAVVTNTPTAATIFELLERAIAAATRTATAGPPTPLPVGLLTATPTRTATPAPLNAETAQALVIQVTIEALANGTWTPTPTRTPTTTPRPGATAAATPAPTLPPVDITLVDGAAQGVVTADIASVNVRAGPGPQFPVVGVLPIGTQLSLVGRNEDGSWLLACCVDGQSVWLAQFLLRREIDIQDLPVQPAPTGLLDNAVAALRRLNS